MKLVVPHFPEEKPNSCWHAAARMVYGFKKAACIHPLPNNWTKDQGIAASEFVDLAKRLETLQKVNQPKLLMRARRDEPRERPVLALRPPAAAA
jgi:hypothetical protein